jgi:putative Holliday junction resolvase
MPSAAWSRNGGRRCWWSGCRSRQTESAHDMTRRAERFARQLHGRFRLPVELVDERFSSLEAEGRLRGRRAGRLAVDSVAAQLILEQYLDERAA